MQEIRPRAKRPFPHVTSTVGARWRSARAVPAASSRRRSGILRRMPAYSTR